MLAPGFGLFFALAANILTYKIFGDSYYEKHRWPKLGVLLMAGLACLVVGLLIRKKRAGETHQEHAAGNSISSKLDSAKDILHAGPRDHLMYIPLHYWSLAYFIGAIVYLSLADSAPARP